jgi:hypothetical protein
VEPASTETAVQVTYTLAVPDLAGEWAPRPKLAAALAEFQAEIPRIAKTSRAEYDTRDSARVSYDYAELSEVTDAALPLLARCGLSFTAKPTWLMIPEQGIRFVLVYKLMHVSGEQEVGIWPLPPPDRAGSQQLGSAITYARRYSFQAVTGVAPGPGEDDDARAAQDAPRPEAVPDPVGIEAGQRRRIRNRLTELGIHPDSDEQRMAWVTGLRGVYTESLDELSREDAAAVLDELRPATRAARNDVIAWMAEIGVHDPEGVMARLAEWTGRAIAGTGDLCMAEVKMVMRKTGEIRDERARQDAGPDAENPGDEYPF